MRRPRTDALTAGMPVENAIAVAGSNGAGASLEATTLGGGGGGDGVNSGAGGNSGGGGNSRDVGLFHDLLVRQPSKALRKLMLTGVDVVQRGMDVYQSASSKVYDVARTTIGRPRITTGSATAASAATAGPKALGTVAVTSNENSGQRPKDDGADSSGGGSSSNGGRSRKRNTKTVSGRARTGGLAGTVIDLLDTGIGGMEQMTDLGLLLGNIGTHKIRAKLDGQSGNKEILKLLVKYVGSRAGMGAKGSPVQMIDDVGTISTFVANDDEVTTMISTLMERVMNDPEVSKALVRLVITVLDGNPSTQCVLDKLPLSPADLRMLFDVFVGSNGQAMMKTVAGLVSDLTTGPDTKAFLESALGMASMFKSSSSTSSEKPENPKSIFGSLTGLFTGGDIDVDDNVGNEEITKKPVSPTPIPKRPPLKKPSNNNKNKEDPWFSSEDKTISKPVSNTLVQPKEDIWFSGDSDRYTTSKPVSSGGAKLKPDAKLKRPVKINEKSKDKDNSGGKKNTNPGGNKARNINISDNGVDTNKNGNKKKKKIMRPMKKAKSENSDSTNDDFWFNDEKNEKISPRKTEKNNKTDTVARN